MITLDAEARMRAALSALEADADRAEAAAPGVVSRAWSWVIGAESSASAARVLAGKAREDAERFRARFVSLVASPWATDVDAARFISDAEASFGAGGGAARTVAAAAELLSPVTAVRETAEATARDLGLPASPAAFARFVKVGAAVVVVSVVLLAVRDARRMARGEA